VRQQVPKIFAPVPEHRSEDSADPRVFPAVKLYGTSAARQGTDPRPPSADYIKPGRNVDSHAEPQRRSGRRCGYQYRRATRVSCASLVSPWAPAAGPWGPGATFPAPSPSRASR
jgi:hypothetical protein